VGVEFDVELIIDEAYWLNSAGIFAVTGGGELTTLKF